MNKRLEFYFDSDLLQVESVIFNGENVHRIHGVAFPSAKELKEFVQSNRLS